MSAVMSGAFDSVSIIKAHIAAAYGVTTSQLIGKWRASVYVRPRMIAMAIARELLPEMSLPAIGREFGDRDHTTVMHAVGRVAQYCRSNEQFALRYHTLLGECDAAVRAPGRDDAAIHAVVERLVTCICTKIRAGLMKTALRHPAEFVQAVLGGTPMPAASEGQAPPAPPAPPPRPRSPARIRPVKPPQPPAPAAPVVIPDYRHSRIIRKESPHAAQ